jgi:seryl-tRNA synthetase
MHDIKAIRDDAAAFTAGLKRRGLADAESVTRDILERDQTLRHLQTSMQQAQARRNEFSKQIGIAKVQRNEAQAQELMRLVAIEKESIQQAEDRERQDKAALERVLAELPNIPADDVPIGTSEDQNVEVTSRRYGSAPGMNAPKDHVELGEKLGVLDFEKAAQVAGARFVYLKGPLARMERALASFMLDIATKEFAYEEIVPPLLVRSEAMFGTGQLPKFFDELFAADTYEYLWELTGTAQLTEDESEIPSGRMRFSLNSDDSLWLYFDQERKEVEQQHHYLVPTAEVPLTNYVREEILDERQLPLRFTAYTPCFRAEAGAAGKDTRGMIRMHQFSKVELVSITAPEQSNAEHERMTDCAQQILKTLELHHRVVMLCTGDLGFSARKTYDIEVWLPGQNRFREISSCSNCGDFQARRMNARFRPKDAKQTRFVHTLNGSSLALGRTMVAIMENYQQSDGSIAIPDALRPYMGGQERIAK